MSTSCAVQALSGQLLVYIPNYGAKLMPMHMDTSMPEAVMVESEIGHLIPTVHYPVLLQLLARVHGFRL